MRQFLTKNIYLYAMNSYVDLLKSFFSKKQAYILNNIKTSLSEQTQNNNSSKRKILYAEKRTTI